jgi:hypothetical protein
VILGAAVDSDLLDAHAGSLAKTCNIPITLAHGYLTDVALRQPAIIDTDGAEALAELLGD